VTDVAGEGALNWRTLLGPGLEAVRRYWRPFVLLQGVALLLVLGYFHSPAVRQVCETLVAIKQRWGLLFSALAAAVAGVVLPEAAKVVALGLRRFDRQRWRDIAFALALFAVNGMITDLQYRFLGWVYGTGAEWPTVLAKVFTDQFGTTPLYGVPYWILLYAWRANAYDARATLGMISGRWYVTRVLPLLIPAWFFWVPMTMLIYSLPGPLQLWLFALAMGAWSLVMIFVASNQPRAQVAAPRADR
jgi:hypothetical protein